MEKVSIGIRTYNPPCINEFRTSQILRDPLSFSKIHYEKAATYPFTSQVEHANNVGIRHQYSVFYAKENT
jgi:hypothetical protein